MNIKKKKILIYGIGRFQKDFEYLFPNMNIQGYIVDRKNINEYNNKPCYYYRSLPCEIIKGNMIILCDRKNSKLSYQMNKLNLIEKKDYYWFEDLGYLLNDKIDYISEQILRLYRIYILGWKNYKIDYISNEEILKRIIYADSYDNVKCMEPFNFANIQYDGMVYSCCPGWAYNKMGNLFFKSPEKMWNSNFMKLHRLSIINKTYALCDKSLCNYLKTDSVRTDTRFDDLVASETPENIYVCIDRSCNLKCKSCRKEFLNAKGLELKLINKFASKLTNSKWVQDSKMIMMAGQGEVFFSKVYQKMLFNSPMTKRDNIDILTNGTMMSKEKLDKLCNIYKQLKVHVTMDAVTNKTYEKLRIGGNFNNLMKNLEYLSELRKQNKVVWVELLFIVQRDNYKEMIEFIKLAKKYKFDRIGFSQIANWDTYSDEEFKKISMINEFGMPKLELKKVLSDPAFKDKRLLAKTNITKFVGDKDV